MKTILSTSENKKLSETTDTVYEFDMLRDLKASILKLQADAKTIDEPVLTYMFKMTIAEINTILSTGRR